jgi:hypothetical protein
MHISAAMTTMVGSLTSTDAEAEYECRSE